MTARERGASSPENSLILAPRVLVFGYGNPGREDDGLGPLAAAEIERMQWPHVIARANYQLVIEDAVDVAEADVVWFIDSARTGPEPYQFRQLSPSSEIAFTSHIVKPEVVLALARGYYHKSPAAYLLGIRGYQFEFVERITDRARRNLSEALSLITRMIREGRAV
jgi:hydrogenase maturation protease